MNKVIIPAVFLTLVGCAVSSQGPEAPRFSKELRHEIIQGLVGRNQGIRTLRGIGTARLGSSPFSGRSDFVLLVKKPVDLRIDSLMPTGLHGIQIALTDGWMTIHWAHENRYFQGLASPERLTRFFSLPLDADSAVRLLSGEIPLEEEDDYSIQLKGKKIVLKGRQGDLIVTPLEGENGYLPVQYTAWDADGSQRYLLKYDDYEKKEGRWIAKRLSGRSSHSHFEFHFREIEINPSLADALFQLKIPDDAAPISD